MNLYTFENDEIVIKVVAKLGTSALYGANSEIQLKNNTLINKYKPLVYSNLKSQEVTEDTLNEPLETYKIIELKWKIEKH